VQDIAQVRAWATKKLTTRHWTEIHYLHQIVDVLIHEREDRRDHIGKFAMKATKKRQGKKRKAEAKQKTKSKKSETKKKSKS